MAQFSITSFLNHRCDKSQLFGLPRNEPVTIRPRSNALSMFSPRGRCGIDVSLAIASVPEICCGQADDSPEKEKKEKKTERERDSLYFTHTVAWLLRFTHPAPAHWGSLSPMDQSKAPSLELLKSSKLTWILKPDRRKSRTNETVERPWKDKCTMRWICALGEIRAALKKALL